jgi:hypothetical protein
MMATSLDILLAMPDRTTIETLAYKKEGSCDSFISINRKSSPTDELST